MPSTCNCVLSLVMQICDGTSSGISRRSCRYATRSTIGTTKLSPGSSTAWNLPQRSITSACCCGTTRMVLMMTMMATINSASVTIEEPMRTSIVLAFHGGRSAGGKNEHRTTGCRDVHGFGLRCIRRCEFCVPGRATVADPRRAAGAPALHVHHLPHIEARLLRRGPAALPPFQQGNADDTQDARGKPLIRSAPPQPCRDA